MKESIIEKFGSKSLAVVPILEPGARDKVLGFLKDINTENTRYWSSISTIAKGTRLSAMYTRAVLQKLCDDQDVECARHASDKKMYFRIRQG